MKQITLNHIVYALNRRDEVGRKAVTMAIIRLYERQTEDEQHARTARYQNGRGFSAFDAKSGTYMARWATYWGKRGPGAYRLLSGKYVEKARKMALRYRRQLLEIAQEKQAIRERQAEQHRQAEERARRARAEQARLNAEHSAHIVSMLESEEEPPTERAPRVVA